MGNLAFHRVQPRVEGVCHTQVKQWVNLQSGEKLQLHPWLDSCRSEEKYLAKWPIPPLD